MRSISVNGNTYDIGLDINRNLAMVIDKACVQQDCLLASQMFLGEFPYDTTRGVDFMGTLFQNKNPYAFEESMKGEIASVPNVTAVTDFQMLQISDVMQYEASISTSFGNVDL